MAETALSVDRPVDRSSKIRAVAGSRSTARSTEINREQTTYSQAGFGRPLGRPTGFGRPAGRPKNVHTDTH